MTGESTMLIDILGSKWQITKTTAELDDYLEEIAGYCDYTTRKIVVREEKEGNGVVRNLHIHMQKTIRHEIVHAFLFESGLSTDSNETDAWARNEEMVDWIAFQGPKIMEAWKYAGVM